MTLTGLEASLVGGFFISAGAVLGALIIHYLNTDKCIKCGIVELREDIKVQFYMIRALAEKSGLTEDDLLRIETMARKAGH